MFGPSALILAADGQAERTRPGARTDQAAENCYGTQNHSTQIHRHKRRDRSRPPNASSAGEQSATGRHAAGKVVRVTDRKVLSTNSSMKITTSRIGLLTIHATAPIVEGHISDTHLTFTVRIDEVNTGNPLLDPELHALIHEVTSGTLTFTGQRTGEVYAGSATAGQITVPLELSTTIDESEVAVAGNSTFQNVHLPLPGMGHIKHLSVDIDGSLYLD